MVISLPGDKIFFGRCFFLDFDMNFILLAHIGIETCSITGGDSMNREQIGIAGHKSTRTNARRLCWHPGQQGSRAQDTHRQFLRTHRSKEQEGSPKQGAASTVHFVSFT